MNFSPYISIHSVIHWIKFRKRFTHQCYRVDWLTRDHSVRATMSAFYRGSGVDRRSKIIDTVVARIIPDNTRQFAGFLRFLDSDARETIGDAERKVRRTTPRGVVAKLAAVYYRSGRRI